MWTVGQFERVFHSLSGRDAELRRLRAVDTDDGRQCAAQVGAAVVGLGGSGEEELAVGIADVVGKARCGSIGRRDVEADEAVVAGYIGDVGGLAGGEVNLREMGAPLLVEVGQVELAGGPVHGGRL